MIISALAIVSDPPPLWSDGPDSEGKGALAVLAIVATVALVLAGVFSGPKRRR